jgi:hypothetical protein
MAKKKTGKSRPRKPKKDSTPSSGTPIHPWRLCPYGEHQVVEHPRQNPPSKTHPSGSVSTVRWYCAHNPTGRDELYVDEIKAIAGSHFSGLKNKPCSLSLDQDNGSKFDEMIAGWVQYWNDILKPNPLLDANLVKALIASESGFDPDALHEKKDSDSARGLMQITNESRKLLNNEKELKDHYVIATKKELNDPAVNICAGVRWLFRKREIASIVRLKRQATWLEAAAEFKGDLKGVLNKNKSSQAEVDRFLDYLARLEKCKK